MPPRYWPSKGFYGEKMSPEPSLWFFFFLRHNVHHVEAIACQGQSSRAMLPLSIEIALWTRETVNNDFFWPFLCAFLHLWQIAQRSVCMVGSAWVGFGGGVCVCVSGSVAVFHTHIPVFWLPVTTKPVRYGIMPHGKSSHVHHRNLTCLFSNIL